jgi:hypothetical protein
MRFTEFKLVQRQQQLNEGYTAGDLAETVWGAAVAAAFAKYPATANEQDIISVISNLDNSLTWTQDPARPDGLEGKLTDRVIFTNSINMDAHKADLANITKSIAKIKKQLPGIIADANAQVKSAGLDLKDIFANGKADQIVVGAEGGADQKGTKVDVSIVHKDAEGKQEVKRLSYSLKTDTGGSGVMPVSQAPGLDKGSGGQVDFFKGLGIEGELGEPSIEDNESLEDKMRQYVDANASDGKLDSVYEKELRAMRRTSSVGTLFTKNVEIAADQINSQIDTDGEEAAFLNDIVKFFQTHINKEKEGLKLLTFDAKGSYTTTVEKFAENVRNITLRADAVADSSGVKKLLVKARDEDGTESLIVEIRLKFSGGRFSGSKYRAALKKNKNDLPSGYELLRYTIVISTGPGYKKSAIN